jgi:hypothetical protein
MSRTHSFCALCTAVYCYGLLCTAVYCCVTLCTAVLQMISHGKVLCQPTPACTACPLEPVCEYALNNGAKQGGHNSKVRGHLGLIPCLLNYVLRMKTNTKYYGRLMSRHGFGMQVVLGLRGV